MSDTLKLINPVRNVTAALKELFGSEWVYDRHTCHWKSTAHPEVVVFRCGGRIFKSWGGWKSIDITKFLENTKC